MENQGARSWQVDRSRVGGRSGPSHPLPTVRCVRTADTLIYGERTLDLLPGLLKLRNGHTIAPDGSYRFDVRLEPSEAAPLRRALMRIEAELICEEADRIVEGSEEDPPPDVRRGEALLRLVTVIGAR